MAGLRSLAGYLEKEHGLGSAWKRRELRGGGRGSARYGCFRCLRELLLNVARHAGADGAAAGSLRRDERQPSLAVPSPALERKENSR